MPPTAFAALAPLPRRPRRTQTCSTPRAALGLPADYDTLRAEAIASTRAALAAGERLLELQFPPAVPNMATAALNELYDANRVFTREFLRPFTPRLPPHRINVVFPDRGEAVLAARAWGETPFQIRYMPDKVAPPFVSGDVVEDGMVVVVNPGFNVSEWINMELLEGDSPIVLINGDLDKVRGGYYPRLFYPGLHAAKERFLARFMPTYYIKQFSNGGTLIRRYPEPWRLYYRNASNTDTTLILEREERPEFVEVEKALSGMRTKDLLNRK